MIRTFLILALGVQLYARCPDSQIIFACTTTNAKQIEVCDNGTTIGYRFGKVGKAPELTLTLERDRVTTYQWQGVGRSEYYSVTIPNNDARYEIYWDRDRLDPNQDLQAGIDVEINNHHVATIKCKSEIINNIPGVDLAPTPE